MKLLRFLLILGIIGLKAPSNSQVVRKSCRADEHHYVYFTQNCSATLISETLLATSEACGSESIVYCGESSLTVTSLKCIDEAFLSNKGTEKKGAAIFHIERRTAPEVIDKPGNSCVAVGFGNKFALMGQCRQCDVDVTVNSVGIITLKLGDGDEAVMHVLGGAVICDDKLLGVITFINGTVMKGVTVSTLLGEVGDFGSGDYEPPSTEASTNGVEQKITSLVIFTAMPILAIILLTNSCREIICH